MADKPILEKEFNVELDVDKAISEGSILARLFIEVQGNDKDACQKALERTIFDSLSAEQSVDMLNVKFFELTKDDEKGFFSGVVEVRLLFRDFRWFVNVVMRYGPSAMEIIEPHEVRMGLDQMQSILADVSEMSQTFTSQILSLLKDEERKKLYTDMLKGSESCALQKH
jgi:hypothetical protein